MSADGLYAPVDPAGAALQRAADGVDDVNVLCEQPTCQACRYRTASYPSDFSGTAAFVVVSH